MRGNNKEKIFEKKSDKSSLIESQIKAEEEDSTKLPNGRIIRIGR